MFPYVNAIAQRGSSPRVRSRPRTLGASDIALGIISACAEQTTAPPRATLLGMDHLRVCGADNEIELWDDHNVGSSPRVRSRPTVFRAPDDVVGIISACAEQTGPTWNSGTRNRDHLRVCGADPLFAASGDALGGSSPRVRSRLIVAPVLRAVAGIISACAEQTGCPHWGQLPAKDHLRVCGADRRDGECVAVLDGSSPRVRSRRTGRPAPVPRQRIISACAEQTFATASICSSHGDHLRVCGADSCILLWFGLVGCRGIFDSCTARGRKTTWIPISGIDALNSRMFLCEIGEPSPCAEFWLRLHWLHCVRVR